MQFILDSGRSEVNGEWSLMCVLLSDKVCLAVFEAWVSLLVNS